MSNHWTPSYTHAASGRLINAQQDRLLKIHALVEELTSSPWSHDVIELAMATTVSPLISEQDTTAWVWLLFVGVPSSDKTAMVLNLKHAPKTLFVDSLTENALSSGYAPERGKERKPDLFESIEKGGLRCVLFKDLTTLFSLKDDRVKKIIGELQSAYDGEFAKATGTVGLRRYQTCFSIIGCITPLALINHHRYMAKIGSRFLSYRVQPLNEEEREQGFELSWETSERSKKLQELRQLVEAHVDALFQSPIRLEPESQDQKVMLNRLAKLLARGRGTVSWRKTPWSSREIDEVQIEEPFRALQQLRNLGRALTLTHGRQQITHHEMELLQRMVLGSIPADRDQVLALFCTSPEGLMAKACGEAIGKSSDRALQLLKELERLGLVSSSPGQPIGKGRPPDVYSPVPEFADLISMPIAPLDHILDLQPGFYRHNSPQDAEGEY